MAEQNVKLNMILGMVDKITSPIKKVSSQTTQMTDKIKQSKQQLDRLGSTSKDIEHFKKLKTGTKATAAELAAAQGKVEQLSQQMKAADKPTRKLTSEFNRATAAAQKLKGQHQGQQVELQQLRGKLTQAGVSTRKLGDATKHIRTETEKYNHQLEKQQQQLAAVAKQQQKTAAIKQRNSEMRSSASVDAVGVGAAIYGVKKLVDAYGEVASAQGTIKSLGIDDSGIAAITAQAKAYSSAWAGTTQSEFIRASYDIKSGISSLSDAAVGEMTKIAALTAGATKSSTSEMTKLFAAGYGTYRQQFSAFGAKTIEGWKDLSDAEKDMKFGEYFSAGIASSVQAFRTDGNEMKGAMNSLGAAGTAAKVSFAEQLSVLGKLQQTMSGSEAGTKYKAFLGSAVKAQEKLGLSFTDANNKLLTTPEILDQLRGKYGETMDAIEEKEIKDAFGTDEAVAMIKTLYPEVDTLKDSIGKMNQSLAGGMDVTNKMAKSILQGPAESFQLLGQRVNNATASVGKVFAPTLVFAAGVVGGFADTIAGIMETFPLLSNVLAIAVTAIIAFKVASIAARFAVATYSDATLFARKVMDFFTLSSLRQKAALVVTKVQMIATTTATWAMSTAQKAAAVGMNLMTGAQWLLNAALSANPIGLVIIAIAGLIALAAALVDDWSPVIDFFSGLWDGVVTSFSWAWEFIKTAFKFSPLGLLIQAWDPILAFFSGLWDGVKNLFTAAWDYIYNIFIAPIAALKETLGGLWDSMFGSDSSVDVNQNVTNETISSGGAVVSPVGGGVSARAAVPSQAVNKVDYGGITVQAAPGMDEQALAVEVRKQIDERDRAKEQRNRGRLYD